MSLDQSSLESDLRQLRTAALDDALLARLDACAGNTWTDLDPAAIRFEQQLQQIAPATVPSAVLAALESAVAKVPFPDTANIVSFPKPQTPAPRHHRTWWSAAAVVALSGAVTALLVPTRHGPQQLAAAPPETPTTMPARPAGPLVPADFNRSLTEARNEGVIWQTNDQPHRVLKVIYRDQVTLRDAAGRTYQLERRPVEYILVPAQTD